MSDCVYVAWAEAARDLGVEPADGSRELIEMARSLFGEPGGLWAGATPQPASSAGVEGGGLSCAAVNIW